MIPFGSSAALIARMTASEAGSLVRASRSRLSRPTPCSAENEPPMRATIAVHDFVHRVPSREERGLVRADRLGHVEMDVAVAEMAEGAPPARPARRPRPPRVASSMKAGTAPTATETSCLIEPPSRICASGIDSRSFQNSCRWSSEAAIAASSIASALERRLERAGERLVEPVAGSATTPPSAHTRRARPRAARARARARTVMSCADARRSARSSSPPPPSRSRASPSSSSARSGLARPTKAVAARPRIGKQPQRRGGDDPERALGADEQVLHVVAGVVLAQLASSALTIRPSASTASTPVTSSRALP